MAALGGGLFLMREVPLQGEMRVETDDAGGEMEELILGWRELDVEG